MKKVYETPDVTCILLNLADVVTVSDNDAEWDPLWNGIIS